EFRRFFEEFQRRPFGLDDDEPVPQEAFGSGFLVDPKGVILTNHHVVNGATEVDITLQDDRKFKSTDIRSDPRTDLAIIRFKADAALPYLEFGDSSQMEQGDRVLAIGAPFGLTGSVTSGIVSAKGRSLSNGPGDRDDFLQTDAAINPGNSGGPLVNLEGKVVGINSAIKSRSGGFQGVGMAISSDLAKDITSRLLKDGVVRRGYLGVNIRDVGDEEAAKKLGLKEASGVLVTNVSEGAPGEKAGMKRGDVIVQLAGKPVKDGRELQGIVAGLAVGKPVEAVVVRDGKEKKLKVIIEEQPKDFGTTSRAPDRPEVISLREVGLSVTDLTAELAGSLGDKGPDKGAVVVSAGPRGLAFSAGLRRGMLITGVDKKTVTSAKGFAEALRAASLEKGARVRVQSRAGGTTEYLLKAESDE